MVEKDKKEMEMVENDKKEMKVLQFFVDRNGKCTYTEFNEFDNDPNHLAPTLEVLIWDGRIHDNYRTKVYTLTDNGNDRLNDLKAIAEGFTQTPQDSEES